jgi:hypothetical protein
VAESVIPQQVPPARHNIYLYIGHFSLSVFGKNTMFRKLAIPPSSSKVLKPTLLGPLERAEPSLPVRTYELAPFNGPNSLDFIFLPDDGGTNFKQINNKYINNGNGQDICLLNIINCINNCVTCNRFLPHNE